MNRFWCAALASLGFVLTTVGACSSETPRSEPTSTTETEHAEPTSATTESETTSALPEELDVQPSLRLECHGTATDGPPENFEVVSNAVALPSSPDHPALGTSRREAADGSTYFFAKTGLIWNSASSFEIVVPDALRSRMAIGWGGPAPHGHSVEVNCDGEEHWVGLPGGYWVTEPLCADLLVRTATEELTIQIGLGTPCEGQAPPQGPSDS